MVQRITSAQNSLIKHLCKLRLNCDYREEHQSVFIEGTKMVKEIGANFPLYTLLAVDETLFPEGIEAYKKIGLSFAVFQKICGTNNPEGIAAEVALPTFSSLEGKKHLIVLEGINDPGNLGTLLRTALALGWGGAFLLKDTCDPFNEKAIRAAKGATFRLPLAKGGMEQIVSLIKRNRLIPYVADLKGSSVEKVPKKEANILLVLGNEGHGPSEQTKEICQAITIPMQGPMESLNVASAGAILMYEFAKGWN